MKSGDFTGPPELTRNVHLTGALFLFGETPVRPQGSNSFLYFFFFLSFVRLKDKQPQIGILGWTLGQQ